MMTKNMSAEKWERDFVLALRSRDVTGAAIGSALEEVKAHCAETGEAPGEAFGPPQQYATTLDFANTAKVDPRQGVRTMVGMVVALVALGVVPDSVAGVIRHRDLVMHVGQVVSITALIGCCTLLTGALRWLMRRPTWLAPVVGLALLLIIMPNALWRQDAFRVDPHWPAFISTCILIGAVLFVLREVRHTPDDSVTDPVTGTTRATPSWLSLVSRLYPLAIWVAAAGLTVVSVFSKSR